MGCNITPQYPLAIQVCFDTMMQTVEEPILIAFEFSGDGFRHTIVVDDFFHRRDSLL